MNSDSEGDDAAPFMDASLVAGWQQQHPNAGASALQVGSFRAGRCTAGRSVGSCIYGCCVGVVLSVVCREKKVANYRVLLPGSQRLLYNPVFGFPMYNICTFLSPLDVCLPYIQVAY